jgi:hypothetical protein
MLITIAKLARAAVPGQPNLKGYAAVKVGEITICDCRIIQQAGQKAYVTGPQKQVGQNFYPLVLMTTELREKVQAVVINAALQAGIVTATKPALPDNTQYQAGDLLSALHHEEPGH